MKGAMLMRKLEEADWIEESIINILSGIIQFHTSHGFSFGANEQDKDEMMRILKKLHDDSIRHKGILDDTRALIEGAYDDF